MACGTRCALGLALVLVCACGLDSPDPGAGESDGAGTTAAGSTSGASGSGSDGSSESTGPDPGAALHLNHIQTLGTHNSYHVAPEAEAPFWAYTMPPLDEQLGEHGIRQFELDVHYEPGVGLTVHHVPLDRGTTCEMLVDCLSVMRGWSEANPAHHLLFVFLEPKDDFDMDKLDGRYGEIEDAITSVWPREAILTPDDVRGDHPDLITAVTTDGWPTIAETRGKALFVLFDGAQHRDGYVGDDPSMAGKLMFARGGLQHPFGGIEKMDDPLEEGEAIAEAVAAGLIVRTRADTDVVEPAAGDLTRWQAALESGAQLISTDIPGPVPEYDYELQIPGGTPTRCNPATAPADCTAEAIESL